ncbi:MAG: AmmeMemoRadiSam system radical SAM enzyme [Bacteroidales bacterium]|nr:AmmeMemoRadiSam system radical SAM enzyme [Bacteroidales bacterium]
MPTARFHSALLWEQLANQRVRCFACAHSCNIRPGRLGICGVRKNIEGSLYTSVYEYPVAVHSDPIEKKPLFHFLPGTRALSLGTAGCNFDCSFCQNYEISQMRGDEIKGNFLSVEKAVEMAKHSNCESIAYTYNEPVVFIEYVVDVAAEAKKRGLKNVYISNGFESEETLDLLSDRIDAMNIDLKSFSDKFYRMYCRGKLKPVLNTIRSAYKKGIWLEITTLIIPGENDSDEELRLIAGFIASISKDIPWHLSRFFPTYKMTNKAPTLVSTLERAREIGAEEGLQFIYLGNTPQDHGITFCASCGQKLIIRDRYDLRYNFLDDGACPNCGQKLPGIFQ